VRKEDVRAAPAVVRQLNAQLRPEVLDDEEIRRPPLQDACLIVVAIDELEVER
jgi:hypothetical protein